MTRYHHIIAAYHQIQLSRFILPARPMMANVPSELSVKWLSAK